MAKDREREEEHNPYEDERQPKSEAVRFLGNVPDDHDVRMARTRLTKVQLPVFTMQETQEEALNPKRKFKLLSKTWRHTFARNAIALGGEWRIEMQAVLETQSEEKMAQMSMRDE